VRDFILVFRVPIQNIFGHGRTQKISQTEARIGYDRGSELEGSIEAPEAQSTTALMDM